MLKSNKRPDIIHCHDWQTGLVPVMLYEMYQYYGMDRQRVCYTIHNFRHQGSCGNEILAATGLNRPEYYFDYSRLQDNFNPFALNLMKGGIVYSNYVNTVSPHHAWEARFTEVGYGLGHTLAIHQDKFSGILNGVDYKLWNPQIDELIPFQYSIDEPEGKAKTKQALREKLLLHSSNKPIIAYIGRLDEQKGVHLVHHAIYYALEHNAQFVLLGSGTSPEVNNKFLHEKYFLNDNPDVHLEIGFNEELAHLIYAGADMMVVPSNFEPCGLTQLISLKYGTIPIVRGVGGLLSTVFDRDYDPDHAPEKRNGYVFYQQDYPALESAMERAIGLYYAYPKEFEQLVQQGMEYDYSWRSAGAQYLNVYERIRFQDSTV